MIPNARPVERALSLSEDSFLHYSLVKSNNDPRRTSQRTIALNLLRDQADRGEHLPCPDFSWLCTFTGPSIRAYSRSAKIVCHVERHAGP
jgi:hypothetical protein